MPMEAQARIAAIGLEKTSRRAFVEVDKLQQYTSVLPQLLATLQGDAGWRRSNVRRSHTEQGGDSGHGSTSFMGWRRNRTEGDGVSSPSNAKQRRGSHTSAIVGGLLHPRTRLVGVDAATAAGAAESGDASATAARGGGAPAESSQHGRMGDFFGRLLTP